MCVLKFRQKRGKLCNSIKFQRENSLSRRAFNFLLFVFLVDLQYFEFCQIAEDFLREILNFIIRQIPESFKVKCISLSEKNNASRNVNPIKSETVCENTLNYFAAFHRHLQHAMLLLHYNYDESALSYCGQFSCSLLK